MFISEKEKSALFDRQRELDDRIADILGLVRDHITVCKTENEARKEADRDSVQARTSSRREFRGYLVAILLSLIALAAAVISRGHVL